MSAFQSFGLATPPARAAILPREAIAGLKAADMRRRSFLAYGNGRSYGDSCQADSGTVVDMRGMNRMLSFDPETGLMEAEAGALLSDIIAAAAPRGFFPAVVPGTQFVTLGGAIANDIHGKNHHRRGSFGSHVESLRLLRSDGRLHACSATENSPLFAATIGGMGLTGLILSAVIRLMRVPSLDVTEQVTPFRDLGEYFDLAQAADQANEYAVAWVDQLASGRDAGRGLMMTGNHCPEGGRAAPLSAPRLSVPFRVPVNVLNRPFLSVFNAAYRWRKGASAEPRRSGYRAFFFPLDSLGNWNRLYGPRGLFQHQSVIPFEAAREAIPRMLEAARTAGRGSFLTVLKRFGDVRSPGLLSFPRPGYTLTLDFPNHGASTLALLSELDRITVGAGGAVNPYKDARMAATTFAASFPNWRELERLRDPVFLSAFWARTALRLPAAPGGAAAAA
ncbi:FAD-binding oxidoreductase [Mesorhizobium sp. L-8-3]|uniref:FAD-binding oxidoreductase n=1 Tax=Mesorhizobium sp. L-8-3 TaxID=2744522 RepID=UPI0019266DA5|nr:FAD-binding oxidoreductase [Mesorhizobium sp. L-8-3]BCH24350.1 FAD-linked oxidase [Mesorhizobium sp. L-8-3]